MQQVYITNTAVFLPNNRVLNDEIEDYLGYINNVSSRSKNIVLRNNGIKSRYYALNEDGKSTHSNAEMTSLAIRKIFADQTVSLSDVDLLVCGTSTPDQMIPSHGVMVHGLLAETGNIEVISQAGVCCSGMHALKYAYMALSMGDKKLAVCTGSERVSRIMHSDMFNQEIKNLEDANQKPYIAFEKDFLRFMLSDGAGAFMLSPQKALKGHSLRIDWIDTSSYASETETCMYMGAQKLTDGNLKSYMDHTEDDIMSGSVFAIKQDVKLLSEQIVKLGFKRLRDLLKEKKQPVEEIDYLLPHLSSRFFEDKIENTLKENGVNIPKEKWFTNLQDKGNVGAGSIYLMVDELFKSGKLKKGQKLLLAVPESARFSYVFAMLTVC